MIKKMLLMLPLMVTTMILAIAPKVNASDSLYSVNFLQNYYINYNNGSIASNPYGIHITDKILIQNNTIIINNIEYAHEIAFWNNSTFLGWYTLNDTAASQGASPYLGDYNNVIPQNATHFALSVYSPGFTGTYPVTFSNFQTITILYENPAPTVPEGQTLLQYSIIEGGPYQWTSNDPIPHPQGPFGQYTSLIPVTSNVIFASEPQSISHITLYDTQGNFIGNMYNPTRFTDPTDRSFMNLGLIEGYRIELPSSNNIQVGYIRLNNFSDSGIPSIITNRPLSDFQDLVVTQLDAGSYYVYYANWNGTVQYEFGPYSAGDTFDHTSEAIELLGNDLNREGYTFLGSFDGPNEITNSSITKYAQYGALPQYTVRFYDYDFTTEAYYLYHTMTVYQGQTDYDLPANPTQYGYNFTHWQPPVVNVTGDLDTYAQYDTANFLVTWVDFETGNEIYSQSLPYGSQVISQVNPTKQGYNFVSWYDRSLGSNVDPTTYTVNGPLEFDAIFIQIPTYTIIFRDLNGNTLSLQTVQQGEMPIVPIRQGYARTWDSNITIATSSKTYNLVSETPDPTTIDSGLTVSGTTIIYRTQLPDDYSGITDLFTGVFGGIVGTLMILGEIDLFGLQLSSLLWLFFVGSGFAMIWRFIK